MMLFKSVVLMLSILPSVYAADKCRNGIVGGPVEGKPRAKNFERKGKNCPCSYVSQSKLSPNIYAIIKTLIIVPWISNLQAEAECTVTDTRDAYKSVKGKDCIFLEVNGTKAADDNEYPQINVRYDWKICNYNEGNSKVKLQDSKPSYFKLWRSKPGKKNKKTLFSKVFNETTVLKASAPAGANCQTHEENVLLDTKFGYHFLSAQLQGPTAVKDEFCYAYAFNPISVKYGSCDVRVSALATKYQWLHNDPF